MLQVLRETFSQGLVQRSIHEQNKQKTAWDLTRYIYLLINRNVFQNTYIVVNYWVSCVSKYCEFASDDSQKCFTTL